MKKICFAGLVSETNLGDVVILTTTEQLYKNALPADIEVEFCRLDIQYRNSAESTGSLWHKLWLFLLEKSGLSSRKLKILKLISDTKQQYKSQLDKADLLVLVGGGLVKYKYQRFFIYLIALIEVAEELKIPVVMNAVGIEGYDETDFRCQMLKQALNRSIVKSITARDDIDTLKQLYMVPGSCKDTGKTSDPAVYTAELYGVSKAASDVFAIGLVRGGIFKDNGYDLTADELAEFYSQLIIELENKGIRYNLFTNGLKSDNELLPLIAEKLGRAKPELFEPEQAIDLIQFIAGSAVVIAARLHANIIAYSLDVPSVGLVWNDKLTLFGQDIGYPQRFVQPSQMTATTVLALAMQAQQEGYQQELRSQYKTSVKRHIGTVVDKFIAGQL
jgi:polysaccharide pyruvyl transferase WcaK-like protein